MSFSHDPAVFAQICLTSEPLMKRLSPGAVTMQGRGA